uniref:Uncharacterized protein n=1 Tax=Caenorhabditis japonica TaxID=281687 RepID=A0A8R1EJ75_CAEJA
MSTSSTTRNFQSNRTEDFFEVPLHRFKKLDCMQYQDTSSMSCVSATKCRQENRFRAGIGMCCCTTPNCNVLGNIEQVNPSKKGQ